MFTSLLNLIVIWILLKTFGVWNCQIYSVLYAKRGHFAVTVLMKIVSIACNMSFDNWQKGKSVSRFINGTHSVEIAKIYSHDFSAKITWNQFWKIIVTFFHENNFSRVREKMLYFHSVSIELVMQNFRKWGASYEKKISWNYHFAIIGYESKMKLSILLKQQFVGFL